MLQLGTLNQRTKAKLPPRRTSSTQEENRKGDNNLTEGFADAVRKPTAQSTHSIRVHVRDSWADDRDVLPANGANKRECFR